MNKLFFSLGILLYMSTSFSQFTFTQPAVNGNPSPTVGNNLPADFGCDGFYQVQLDSGQQVNSPDATIVWCNSHTIDLTESFTTEFNIRFGDITEADGIVFNLQRDPNGLNAGPYGAGGHLGVTDHWIASQATNRLEPSVNIEFDIWLNDGNAYNPSTTSFEPIDSDLAVDHAAISFDGDINNPIVPATPITLTNDTWHQVIVEWNSCYDSLIVRLDGDIIMELQEDITNTVFGGDPTGIIFGFSSATQASNTPHDLCFVSHRVSHCSCDNITNPTIEMFQPLCNPDDCCFGVNLYGVATGVPYTVMYDWGDGTQSYSNTHSYSADGIYTITAYVMYALLDEPGTCCIKTVSTQIITNCYRLDPWGGPKSPETGMIQNETPEIKLYPNPVSSGEYLNIQLDEAIDGNLVMYNSLGQEVIQLTIRDNNQLSFQVPAGTQPGIYYIKSNENDFETIQVIVTK